MPIDPHFSAHEDHANWLAEHRAWLADIARWRSEREVLLVSIDTLRQALASEADLDSVEQQIRVEAHEIATHETAIARHEQGGDAGEHDDAEAAHVRARGAHEQLRQAHAQQADRMRRLDELVSELRQAVIP